MHTLPTAFTSHLPPITQSIWASPALNTQDLSRHLSDTLPPAWHLPGLSSPASGWDVPGATPSDATPHVTAMGARLVGTRGAGLPGRAAAGLQQAGRGAVRNVGPGQAGLSALAAVGGGGGRGRPLGVAWVYEGDAADGPSPLWLGKLLSLVTGLAEAAPGWSAPEVRGACT